MSQKFFTTTLICKYIKYLLSKTPLPIYPMIEHNKYMLEGCLYIYKDRVLRCTKSGIFSAMTHYYQDMETLTVRNDLYVLDDKIVKDFLTINERVINDDGSESFKLVNYPLCVTDDQCYINNIEFAKYDIVNSFNIEEFIPGVTQQIISTSNTYDGETHKYLGDYLRLIKNRYNVDLMPLYNCYAQEVANDFYIQRSTIDNNFVIKGKTTNRKVLLVPIKFNTTYTMAMDCPGPVLMKAVIYRNGLLIDKDRDAPYSNYLQDKVIQFNSTNFYEPISFMVPNVEDTHTGEEDGSDDRLKRVQRLQSLERNLYMAIQVPINLHSTLSVIEGDYTSSLGVTVSDVKLLKTRDPSRLYNALASSPSLLKINDNNHHTFSDKLIAYLLRNTIDNRDMIDENIERVEKAIGYHPEHYGLWDDDLRYILHQKYTELMSHKKINEHDILGYVDEDVEEAIRKGYIKYGS